MKLNRRKFIKASTIGCLSAAYSASLLAYSSDESEKKLLSKYTLVFASPYNSSEHLFTPHMHQELKHNIETMSNGLIYVDIRDNGQLGVGTELMAKVTRGHIDAALVSASNLSPALPLLDILNIPFWSAENEKYLNLITSKNWQDSIIEPIKKQKKIEILLHHIPGPRTVTTTKLINQAIREPSDLNNVIFRVAASKNLTKFYKMTKAHVVNVPWGDVSFLAEHGRIEALDPSIIGLYSGPNNLKSNLGVISQINSVQDAWFTVINHNWLKALPFSLQIIVEEAANKTFLQHVQKIEAVNSQCIQALNVLGTTIYQPDEEEKALWKESFGYHRKEWQNIKEKLLGSTSAFNSLLDATKR